MLKGSLFDRIKNTAKVAMTKLDKEIAKIEANLQAMRNERDQYASLIGGNIGTRHAPASRERPRGTDRVKWDEVLAFLPKRFDVPAIMKHPGAASKGRAQVYPALNRWETTGKIKRVGKGIYEKVSAEKGTAPKAKAKKAKVKPRSRAKVKPATPVESSVAA